MAHKATQDLHSIASYHMIAVAMYTVATNQSSAHALNKTLGKTQYLGGLREEGIRPPKSQLRGVNAGVNHSID